MLNQFRAVFASFQEHEVEYVVIGGVAAILHGVPRATFDLDVLIEATPENARRVLDALLDAGLATAALTTAEDLLAHEVTVFEDRVRVDVQTAAPGVTFEEVRLHRDVMDYQGQTFFVLSLSDLIASKRAAGRDVDLQDVRILEETAGESPE